MAFFHILKKTNRKGNCRQDIADRGRESRERERERERARERERENEEKGSGGQKSKNPFALDFPIDIGRFFHRDRYINF